jgi:hypothetical protein
MKRTSTKLKRRATKRITIKPPAPGSGGAIFSGPPGVWSGSIGRLRLYVSQPGLVYAFKSPGNNDNLIGTTEDPNMSRALFLARDNGRTIEGYTDNNGRIVWMDY